MQNGFKQQFLLLGAYGSDKDTFNWCKVRLADLTESKGWDVFELYYGKFLDVSRFNAFVQSGPVPVDCEFSIMKDFKTSGIKTVLKNISVVKG